MALSGTKVEPNTLLLAAITDNLNLLVWSMTKDGSRNHNRPKSIFAMLLGTTEESDVQGFISGEDFEKTRMSLITN